MRHLFEIIPIILACIAAVSCAMRVTKDRRKHDRWGMLLGSISAILLIIAQTSWWAGFVLAGSLQGTWWANAIWTVFNTLTMGTLILLSQPWRKP